MTIEHWLKYASAQLATAGIATARLDCLVLLEDATHKDRAWLLAHSEETLNKLIVREFSNEQVRSWVGRRTRHEPLAYIRGHAKFYGRSFVLNEHVLIPRPETEAIIALSKELILNKKVVHFADIGTGSGCIGVTLKLEFPRLNVDVYDIDKAALNVAQRNADELGADIGIYQSDLLSELRRDYDVLVANLPYVPVDYQVSRATHFEPNIALYSGSDGLDCYRQFWKQVAGLIGPPIFILTEALPEQHSALARLASTAGYQLERTADFVQQFCKMS